MRTDKSSYENISQQYEDDLLPGLVLRAANIKTQLQEKYDELGTFFMDQDYGAGRYVLYGLWRDQVNNLLWEEANVLGEIIELQKARGGH